MEKAASPVWSHPDITLPHLLSLIRAFLDMVILASGYQLTGAPALWRSEEVTRALGWASFLEEIMKRIPVSDDGKGSRRALDAALQEMTAKAKFPVGIPRLSCEVLAEAKRLLICAMSHAVGPCDVLVEPLLAAAYRDQQNWELALQHVSKRCTSITCTKLLFNALKLATPTLNRDLPSDRSECCQQWRHKSLQYLLDEKTLYKLSGAAVIFKTPELHWRSSLTALQLIPGQANDTRVTEIAELCCLHLSSHKWSILINKLLQSCQSLSCSRLSLKLWHSKNYSIQELKSKRHEVEAYLMEMTKGKETLWWNLPSILVAAALIKGSPLFYDYMTELSRHMSLERSPTRCMGKFSDDPSEISDDVFARLWCLQFQEHLRNQGSTQ